MVLPYGTWTWLPSTSSVWEGSGSEPGVDLASTTWAHFGQRIFLPSYELSSRRSRLQPGQRTSKGMAASLRDDHRFYRAATIISEKMGSCASHPPGTASILAACSLV